MCSFIVVSRINLKLFSRSINWLMKMINGNGKNNYRLATWNCRKGLINSEKLPTSKVVEIKNFLYEMNVSLLCVTETDIFGLNYISDRIKLSQDEVVDALQINGYKILLPRSWYVHGVARLIVYVKNELNTVIHKTSLCNSDLQTLTCEISFGKEKKTVVSCVYREFKGVVSGLSDRNSQRERLSRQIKEWNNACGRGNKDTVILGDVNLCAKKWTDEDYHNKDMADMVRHFLLNNECKQMVTDFTRTEVVRGGMLARSCIDHVYTNAEEKIKTSIRVVGNSDHMGVIVEKINKVRKLRNRVVKKRSYKHFDTGAFLTDIFYSDIVRCVTNQSTIESAAEIFESSFKSILDLHAPIKTFQQRKKYLPFLSDETKKIIVERRVVMEEAVKNNDIDLLKEGKRLGRFIKLQIKADEERYYETELDVKTDSKRAWKVVREVLNANENLTPTRIKTIDSNGYEEIVTNPGRMANEFNNYFSDKVKKIREEVNKKSISVPPAERLQNWLDNAGIKPPGFRIEEIGVNEFRRVMKKFKPKRVHGIDWIDSFSLKIAAPLIEDALIHMINLSIKESKFSKRWKPQLIFPLFKRKERELVQNYRPVSHVVQVGKLLEMVVFDQVYTYFESNDLFHPSQYGGIKKHSTATAIIHAHELFLEAMDSNQLSAACLLDQTAAFDLLCHQTLRQKLKVYNFGDNSINWIMSYLGERSQIVQVESKLSEEIMGSDFAIPQGSVLGCLIHVINCNDLPACHNENYCESVVYIDDDSDIVSATDSNSLRERIQAEASKSAEWIVDNKLCVSGEKSKLLIVGSRALKKSRINEKISIIIDGKEVEETCNEKLLGVVINNELGWKPHIYGDENNLGLIQKLAQRVGIIRKLANKMSRQRLRILAEGFFYSTIKYCIQVYGNVFGLKTYKIGGTRYSSFTVAANNDLQVLQNKLNRILLNKYKDISTEELCRQTDSLSVQQMIAVSTMTTAVKILKTKKPSFLYSRLVINERKTALIQPLRKGQSCEGFVHRAISLLNKMGLEILNTTTDAQASRKIRTWVSKNIEVKPRRTLQSMRFGKEIAQPREVVEVVGRDDSTVDPQRRITDFFRTV